VSSLYRPASAVDVLQWPLIGRFLRWRRGRLVLQTLLLLVAALLVIDGLPDGKRVGVLVSGHLSPEVGGPMQFERRLMDPDFDARAVGWIATGDIDAAARDCSLEQMVPSGNMTMGFLNFLMAMGVAKGASPTHAEGLDVGFPAVPFFAWEQKEEGAGL